jgi:hypothetical protein
MNTRIEILNNNICAGNVTDNGKTSESTITDVKSINDHTKKIFNKKTYWSYSYGAQDKEIVNQAYNNLHSYFLDGIKYLTNKIFLKKKNQPYRTQFSNWNILIVVTHQNLLKIRRYI